MTAEYEQQQDGQAAEQLEAALVTRAARGDVECFTHLARRYYPPLVAIAHSIVGDRHLAEDAAQQALATAAAKLAQLRQADRFGTWLATICRNAAKRMTRSAQTVAPQQALPAGRQQGVDDDVTAAVRAALEQLSAEAREVVFLRYYDGLSYRQISAVLGISEQAINGRLRRAKKKLAEYLRDQGVDEVR